MGEAYTPKVMPANGREMRVIERLAGFDKQLIEGEKHLKARLKSIPNAWRDFRLACTCTEKVLDEVYSTLPYKNLLHVQKLVTFGETVIRQKPAIKLPGDVQFVNVDDLKYLINVAISAECAVCSKDKREQKKCKLRDALSTIALPAALKNDGLCPYTHVAEKQN